MREIKFRCWDGDNIIFFDLALCNDETSKWYSQTVEGNPVMQYTGMIDKNGCEIYEGDVLDWIDEVRFSVIYKFNGWRKKFSGWPKDLDQYNLIDLFDLDHYEVIGNIYESPYLTNQHQKKVT